LKNFTAKKNYTVPEKIFPVRLHILLYNLLQPFHASSSSRSSASMCECSWRGQGRVEQSLALQCTPGRRGS